jgi:hypothetical protein
MATCAHCQAHVGAGDGKWDGPLRFCGSECLNRGAAGAFAVPSAQLQEAIRKIHQGDCPQCSGPGPVDLHTAYHVWSIILWTQWSRSARLSCDACARSARRKAARRSLALGWWGFPAGIVMTPVQIWRNLAANRKPRHAHRASQDLVDFVHARLTEERVASQGRGFTVTQPQ